MNFLTVFVRPPGDLIYYILIMAVVLGCTLMTVGHHLWRGNRMTARLSIGAVGVLVAWLLLMAAAVFNVMGSGNGLSALQALEHAVTLLMLISLGWAFITSDSTALAHYGDRIAAGLSVGVLALWLLTGGAFIEALQMSGSPLVFVWLLAPIALLIGGVLVTTFYRDVIHDVPLKLVFAAVLLIGYTASFVQYTQGNVDSVLGAMRLGAMAGVCVALMLLYRTLMKRLVEQVRVLEQTALRPPIVSASAAAKDRPAPASGPRPVQSNERESMQLLHALGLMIEDARPSALPIQVVRAALEVLRADIGALIRVQDANYADIVIGFDRSRKRVVNGLALNLNDQPTLRNAIERLQQRPLFPDRNQAELDDLYSRLGVDQSGPTYFQPLSRDGQLSAVMMVGFPFSDRELTNPEIEMLKGLGVISAGLLALSDTAEDTRLLAEERAIQAMIQGVPLSQLSDEQILSARQSAMAELQKSRGDVDMLTRQVRQLEERISIERDRLAMTLADTDTDLSISQRVATVGQRQMMLREERDRLMERVRQMESALSGAGENGENSALQSLIVSLQRERDTLLSQRQRLESQLTTLQHAVSSPDKESTAAVIKSLDDDSDTLEAARDQMREKFALLQEQLSKFGVDSSPSGIAQLISQLYSERASLMGRITTLISEKDTLAQERGKLNQRLVNLRDSEQQINQLRRDINNVAADREAIIRQRDTLKAQRNELVERFEAVRKFRERVIERITMLESQLKQNQERFTHLATDGQLPAADNGAMVMELSKATSRIVELERELAALQGIKRKNGGKPLTAEETDMLVGLVQELRSPLTSMRGYIDLMLKETVGILGDMQRKFLQRVAVNVNRLGNMIEDIVRVSALDAGRVQLDHAPVDVVSVVEESVTEIMLPLREKGLEVTLDLPAEKAFLEGDREAFKQVVLQLLTNAYLVAPPHTVIDIQVQVGEFVDSAGGAAGIRLVVEDNGGGIADEDLPRVFLRRFEGENPLVAGLGDTGIGLSIARVLTEMQGGRISVASHGDKTRISVLFKIA